MQTSYSNHSAKSSNVGIGVCSGSMKRLNCALRSSDSLDSKQEMCDPYSSDALQSQLMRLAIKLCQRGHGLAIRVSAVAVRICNQEGVFQLEMIRSAGGH